MQVQQIAKIGVENCAYSFDELYSFLIPHSLESSVAPGKRVLVPFGMGIYLSFCKFTTVTDAKWVGLENFKDMFSDPEFIHALWYTALFALVSVVTINFFAFAVAMLLTKGIR